MFLYFAYDRMKLVNTRSKINQSVSYIDKIMRKDFNVKALGEEKIDKAIVSNILLAIKLNVGNIEDCVSMDERNVDSAMKGKDTMCFNC